MVMVKLQYAALHKCKGAVLGARSEAVRNVATVESVEMFARATAGRFLPRTMRDRGRVRVAENEDKAMIGGGVLSLGGPCWRGEIGWSIWG